MMRVWKVEGEMMGYVAPSVCLSRAIYASEGNNSYNFL